MAIPLNNILRLESLDTNLFRNLHHCENYFNSVYGGQVLAQALMSCYLTVDELLPHSLHAYFLRPGSIEMPVIYDVETVRNGSSIRSRRCVARQKGRPIFNMSSSFHVSEEGFCHQEEFLDSIPSPEDIDPNHSKHDLKEFADKSITSSFDIRPIPQQSPYKSQFWLRYIGEISDNPIEHYCWLAFASDMGILATAIRPHYPEIYDKNIFAASLDHAMWFHSPNFKVNQWLLFSNLSPWSGGARGFSRSSIYSQDKTLVASVTQEGLIRFRKL